MYNIKSWEIERRPGDKAMVIPFSDEINDATHAFNFTSLYEVMILSTASAPLMSRFLEVV